jgi:structure-specific endonuclease subunit SLX1
LTDRLANLHLLLGSTSFKRWPLKVTFYAADVFRVFQKWTAQADVEDLREGVDVVMDEGSRSNRVDVDGGDGGGGEGKGIHTLDVTYSPLKAYIEKTKAAIESDSLPACSFCHHGLPHDGAATLFCPSAGCSTAGHLECFATAFQRDDLDAMVPTSGSCPSCRSKLEWVDLVKELSLRMRGQKEIEKVLKVRKSRGTKKGEAVGAALASAAEEELAEDDDEEEEELDDAWHRLSDFSDAENEHLETGPVMRSDPVPAFKLPRSVQYAVAAYSEPAFVIEDSDGDEAELVT